MRPVGFLADVICRIVTKGQSARHGLGHVLYNGG